MTPSLRINRCWNQERKKILFSWELNIDSLYGSSSVKGPKRHRSPPVQSFGSDTFQSLKGNTSVHYKHTVKTVFGNLHLHKGNKGVKRRNFPLTLHPVHRSIPPFRSSVFLGPKNHGTSTVRSRICPLTCKEKRNSVNKTQKRY